jgi:hypothetical protein
MLPGLDIEVPGNEHPFANRSPGFSVKQAESREIPGVQPWHEVWFSDDRPYPTPCLGEYMPTRTATPHARRFRPLLFLVAAVLVMLAIGSGITTGASDEPCKDAVATPGAAKATASPTPAAADDTTPVGLDLELRVWKLRIEFPWLKSLPVRPGRSVVISLFEAPPTTN